jgi:hypothetical protein
MPRGSVVKRDVEMRAAELSQEHRAETTPKLIERYVLCKRNADLVSCKSRVIVTR